MKKSTSLPFVLVVLLAFPIFSQSFAQSAMLNESFDDVTFPPAGWQNIQLTGTGLWARTTAGIYPPCSPHSGAGMAFYDNYNFGYNVSAMLVTPALMMPAGLPKNVNFWMYRDYEWPTYADSLEVYYNATPDLNGAVLLGKVARYYWMSDWFEFNYAIPANVSGPYYVIFVAKSGWGNDIFLDDIEIRALYANDVGVTSIISPSAMVIAGDEIVPEVMVKNFGIQAQSNIPVKYKNGQTGQVLTQVLPFLDSAATANVVFPTWTATVGGPYDFIFNTDLLGDEDRSNDTISKQVIGIESNQSYSHYFSGGLYHSLSICNDMTVMAWGRNTDGQLGDGTNTDSNTPVQVANLTDVTRISAGKYHSVAIKEDGTVWCFGKNESGQLGNGGTASSNVPVQVPGLTGISGIAGGDEHTLALKEDGTVWAWGNNYWGQLGNGTYNNSTTPVQVSGISGAIAVAAGEQFSLALLDNGTIYGWGGNQFGQLGNGTLNYSNIPVLASNISDVIDIAVGATHSVALKNDGTVWAWGYNGLGQIGNGNNTDSKVPVQTTGLSGITTISAGNASTYAVRYDGTAWAWGWNYNGQLGNGTTLDSKLPVQVTGLTGMMAIAGGAFHCLALDQEGSLFAWGSNDYGQLGDGTNTESHVPVLITGLCPVLTTFQLTVNIAAGWNMVSTPGLNSPDQNVNTWWAYRDLGANVFKYLGGYQSVTTVTPGIGYWMKHSGARTYNTGDEWPAGGIQIVAHTPLAGAIGWNLIGGYELSVTAANVTTIPAGLQSGPIYKYSGGYQVATTIDPGYGYWIKLLSAGQIIIPETFAKESKPVEYFPENWGRIVLTDATGINYTLYAVKGQVDLSQYDLPPAPPTGMFDIRFSSGRIAEDINSAIKTIDMSGVTYPLTVRVEGMDIRLMDETGKNVNVNLKSGENVVISDATIQKLMVSGEVIPAEYALEQNYPNPFNPATTITYHLPKTANVELKVYDVLGNEVATLVDEEKPAGIYNAQFTMNNFSSGVYFYKLIAGDYVATKKMILIK